jgi:hypothetical protein
VDRANDAGDIEKALDPHSAQRLTTLMSETFTGLGQAG